MCFGPTPSFVSSAVLTAAGTASLKITRSKKEWLFASVPLVFGIQQAIEGLIWVGIKGGPLYAHIKLLGAMYLFFAYLFWPIASPLSVYFLEPEKKNKKILLAFLVAGIVSACCLLYFIFAFDHHVVIVNHSIQYHVKKFSTELGVLYLSATYLPYLFSSYRFVKILGVLNIIFAAIARYKYWTTFDSVWCFFAAVLSVGIFIFLLMQRRANLPKATGPAPY